MGQCKLGRMCESRNQLGNQERTALEIFPQNYPSFVEEKLRSFPPLYQTISDTLQKIKEQQCQLLKQFDSTRKQYKIPEQILDIKHRYWEKMKKQMYSRQEQIKKKNIYKLENGAIFQGDCDNKQVDGLGRILLQDNTYIETEFAHGNPTQYTKIIRKSGDYFSGYVQQMDSETQAIIGNAYGIIVQGKLKYIGYLKNNKPHLEGKQQSNQHIFIGKYDMGNKVQGKLIWNLKEKKRSVYEGEFKDGKFKGIGELRDRGQHYYGQFKNGKKYGKGVLKYSNGDLYEGQFIDDKRNGQGRYKKHMGDLNYTTIQEGRWHKDVFIK